MITKQSRKPFEPPDELDGAEVVLWAFNPEKPFFIMESRDGTMSVPIHGFAICQYKEERQYYKFSCDKEWHVENDMDHGSVEEAVKAATDMSTEPIIWQEKNNSK